MRIYGTVLGSLRREHLRPSTSPSQHGFAHRLCLSMLFSFSVSLFLAMHLPLLVAYLRFLPSVVTNSIFSLSLFRAPNCRPYPGTMHAHSHIRTLLRGISCVTVRDSMLEAAKAVGIKSSCFGEALTHWWSPSQCQPAPRPWQSSPQRSARQRQPRRKDLLEATVTEAASLGTGVRDAALMTPVGNLQEADNLAWSNSPLSSPPLRRS